MKIFNKINLDAGTVLAGVALLCTLGANLAKGQSDKIAHQKELDDVADKAAKMAIDKLSTKEG
jgi:hypothetical protein